MINKGHLNIKHLLIESELNTKLTSFAIAGKVMLLIIWLLPNPGKSIHKILK
jgi:hypothetical protein